MRFTNTPHTTRNTGITNTVLKAITGLGLAHTASLATAATSSLRRRPVAQPAASRVAASVIVVNDPDGTMRLIGVSGAADHTTVDRIRDSIHSGDFTRTVHIDVSEVTRWSTEVLLELEDVLDEAERDGIRLRVVGLDPRLPAMPVAPAR